MHFLSSIIFRDKRENKKEKPASSSRHPQWKQNSRLAKQDYPSSRGGMKQLLPTIMHLCFQIRICYGICNFKVEIEKL